MIFRDLFTGVTLCSSPECHWEVPGGWSGVEARYENDEGEPSCWDHRGVAVAVRTKEN